MRLYELVLVLRPSLKEAERKKFLQTVKDWLDSAKVSKENEWGQRPLAYAIRHETAGHYYDWEIENEEGLPKDLEKKIVANDGVLRHLLLRKE